MNLLQADDHRLDVGIMIETTADVLHALSIEPGKVRVEIAEMPDPAAIPIELHGPKVASFSLIGPIAAALIEEIENRMMKRLGIAAAEAAPSAPRSASPVDPMTLL